MSCCALLPSSWSNLSSCFLSSEILLTTGVSSFSRSRGQQENHFRCLQSGTDRGFRAKQEGGECGQVRLERDTGPNLNQCENLEDTGVTSR